MIKLSKYQIGTLCVIEIKQCDSTQGFSMFLFLVTLWKVAIIHFLNSGLCYLKDKGATGG